MAEFFDEPQDYVTFDAAQIIALCQSHALALGFDFSQDDAEIFTLEKLAYFQKFLNSQSDILEISPENLRAASREHMVFEEIQKRISPERSEIFGLAFNQNQEPILIIASDEELSGAVLHEIWAEFAQLESTNLIQILPILTSDPRWQNFSEKFTKIDPLPAAQEAKRPPILRY